jgi:RNA polymerase sigma-70 factor (ECF subfamily)
MDEKEFHRQLLELRPRLLGWALKRTRTYEDAEDLVQDTLYRVLRAKDQFDSALGSLKSWVSVTMRNRSYDLLRTKSTIALVEISERNLLEHAEQATQQCHVEIMEALSIICTFPEAIQETLRLTFLGYHDSEIAALKNMPLGTIKSHIQKSRVKIQKRLALV